MIKPLNILFTYLPEIGDGRRKVSEINGDVFQEAEDHKVMGLILKSQYIDIN